MPTGTIQEAFDVALRNHQSGRLQEAEGMYRKILAQHPDHAETLNGLGVIALQTGHHDAGVDLIRRAIAVRPSYAEAHSNLGNAFRALGKNDDAIAAHSRAVSLQPNSPEAHNNLGNALADIGQLENAIAAYRKAIALRPNHAQTHVNLGTVLQDMHRVDAAIAAYRRAIVLRPDFADAHHHLALALLLQANFGHAWEEYEWRWKCKNFPSARNNFSQPQWNGCDLPNRTLLLHAEQGLGDTLQFIRYLPLVKERVGAIIFQCQPELLRLVRVSSAEYQIVGQGEPLASFDLHCPLLSLPRLFAATSDNIPRCDPYLHTDGNDVLRWRQRVANHDSVLKIGLAWAGNPTHLNDRNRSMKLQDLAPLFRLPGLRFFSLQKGGAAAQANALPAGMEMIDWSNDLHDFAETAALIANLDLVICVDTAVAHLAGSMGKPVWLMLPFAPDWRWMLNRNDSPWYPTMRLFRQTIRGDWNGVVAEVAEALSLKVSSQKIAGEACFLE
jgi:Flp pilus assembly protein TadD